MSDVYNQLNAVQAKASVDTSYETNPDIINRHGEVVFTNFRVSDNAVTALITWTRTPKTGETVVRTYDLVGAVSGVVT